MTTPNKPDLNTPFQLTDDFFKPETKEQAKAQLLRNINDWIAGFYKETGELHTVAECLPAVRESTLKSLADLQTKLEVIDQMIKEQN